MNITSSTVRLFCTVHKIECNKRFVCSVKASAYHVCEVLLCPTVHCLCPRYMT
jgi:hypothetical protein